MIEAIRLLQHAHSSIVANEELVLVSEEGGKKSERQSQKYILRDVQKTKGKYLSLHSYYSLEHTIYTYIHTLYIYNYIYNVFGCVYIHTHTRAHTHPHAHHVYVYVYVYIYIYICIT